MAPVSFNSYAPSQFAQYSKELREQSGAISQQQAAQIAEHFKVPLATVLALRDELLAGSIAGAEQIGQQTKEQRAMADGWKQPAGMPAVNGVGVNPFMFGESKKGGPNQQATAQALSPDLLGELRDIFSSARLGYSGSVDNFLQAEIGHEIVDGAYRTSQAPAEQKAARAAAVLAQMKQEFPAAFQETPWSGVAGSRVHEGERIYLQALLTQLESLVQTGQLVRGADEPQEAKRARTVLPQLLNIDEPSTRDR